MVNILCRTRGNAPPQGKPRVYFTCHPEDFSACFDKICSDILKTHDCAIYYTKNMASAIALQDQETVLGSNNLFVIPVTYKLLTQPSRAMDADFPYGMKEHIPVLPVMMEPGIDALYARPDKFGQLQYLNPCSTDATEISYEEKLKKYLDSVLISDAMAQRIRAAFDTYVFLSYRKKDRRYANELMRMIHRNPSFRDIAIWYDEFLTPGESFIENIDRLLKHSQLFALLVTPSLLEKPEGKPNFVMGKEYPAAKEAGIRILPVQMEDTDRAALEADFPALPDCADPSEEAQFTQRLLNSLLRTATSVSDDPEHLFLVGLAYMEGIDVEVDRRRGLEMITAAGEKALPEAMEKLYDLYEEGIGTAIDFSMAAMWAQKLIDLLEETHGSEDPEVLRLKTRLAVTHASNGNAEDACRLNREVYAIRGRLHGDKHPLTLASLINLAYSLRHHGQLDEAMEKSREACALTLEVHGQNHPDTLIAHGNLAVLYSSCGDYRLALETEQQVYAISCKVLGEKHPDTLSSLSNLCWNLYKLGKYEQALEKGEEAQTLFCEVLGKEHPVTVNNLSTLSLIHGKLANSKKALELAKEAYAIHCRTLGQSHPSTLFSLNNLAVAYNHRGNPGRALKLLREAYTGLSALYGEDHPDVISTLRDIATCQHNHGMYPEALKTENLVYERFKKRLGETHPDTLYSLHSLASIYNHLSQPKAALKKIQKAYTLQSEKLGPTHPDTLASLNLLSATHISLGNCTQAIDFAKKAYMLTEKTYGETDPLIFVSLSHLISAYMMLKNKKALDYGKKAYNLGCIAYGKEDPKAKELLQQLRKLQALFGK